MSTASETFTQHVSQKKAGDTPGGFAKKAGRLRATLLTLALAGGLFAASGNVPPLDAGKGAANKETVSSEKGLSLVPLPNKIVQGQSTFSLNGKTGILYEEKEPGYENAALYLQKILHQAMGSKPVIEKYSGGEPPKNAIVLRKSSDTELGKEDYRIKVTPEAVVIDASAPAGAFYGIQTFLQLLPTEIYSPRVVSGVKWNAPCVDIDDKPVFPWRGLMLDCSRQFFTVDEIKRLLDQMAFIKLNAFHWHLTDDNGWRMEIKGYPRLTEKGATWEDSTYPDNGKTLFYTQKDIREIVDYAGKLHIRVIPEIELPGHAMAAILSYSELFCIGAQIPEKAKVTDFWNLCQHMHYTPPICLTRPEAVKFLHTVLDQVMELFPDQYIHIGGDEVAEKDRQWSKCPSCRTLMKQKGYTDNDMQKYLSETLRDYVASKGKKIMGWSEIFNRGAIPGVTLMDWIGGRQAALQANCEVIDSPTGTSYLDYKENLGDPVADGGYCSLKSVYNYDPGHGLDAEKKKLVLGSQGNLWTHIARNEAEMNFCLFPRLSAIAERNWTETENKSYASFVHRLQGQFERMAMREVNFNVPEPVCSIETKEGKRNTLAIHNPAGKIGKTYYTLDGSEPSESSKLYREPVALPGDAAVVKAVTIVKEKHKSRTTRHMAPPKAGYYHWSFDCKSPEEQNRSLKTEGKGKVGYVEGRDGRGSALHLADEQAALSLDGTSLAGNWTFSVWINTFSDKSPFSFLISGAEGSLRLLSGKGTGKMEASDHQGHERDFNYALPLNVWTMLSFVQTPEGLSLYVNGVHQDTLSGFVMALPLEMIGNNGTWGYKTLNADLDEISIFPRKLTVSEIAKLHKEGISSQRS